MTEALDSADFVPVFAEAEPKADWSGYRPKSAEEREAARGHFRESVLRAGGVGHLLRPEAAG